ncbi:MAG TPA: hypothetical protein VLW85_14055 [Myxococcales bacterium]|nr:hypothetical protein [Myxococcales bacterium]
MTLALLLAVPIHGAIGFGAGNGYDLVGLRLEGGAGPLTAQVAFTGGCIADGWSTPVSLGLRWSFLRDESGPALSVHTSIFHQPPSQPGDGAETLVMISAIVSWRWRFGPLYLEAGAGPAISHDAYRYPSTDYDALNGVLAQKWLWGLQPGGLTGTSLPLDVEVGAGFAF